jgi:hypothetical protein
MRKNTIGVMTFLLLAVVSTIAFSETAAEKPTALPADGGDIGKAYMAYNKAFAAGDVEALKKMVTAERARQLDDPKMKEMLPMMQSMMAKDIKITGGTMTSKEATLNVEGKDETGAKETGTVHMVLEDKVWKVEKESWKMGQ